MKPRELSWSTGGGGGMRRGLARATKKTVCVAIGLGTREGRPHSGAVR